MSDKPEVDTADRKLSPPPIVPCCAPAAAESKTPLYPVGSRFAAIIGYW